MINTQFDVIYADYPWPYAEIFYAKKSLAVRNQYSLLTVDEGCTIDINSIAAKNSWLFFWIVWAQLPQALRVIDAWGFEYKSAAFVWTKRTKTGKKAKTYGRACGAQGSTEVVLVAKKGSPKHYVDNEEQEFAAERLGHSQKPDVVYGKIERLVTPPDGPAPKKIELFARQQWGDWYALGNDEALNVPSNPLCLFGDIRDIVGARNEQASTK
jgi:N6-adenosine-specific RNA methylase IME4